MEAIKKLTGKAKGNPVFLAGMILSLIVLFSAVALMGGAILIFGLNLIGFSIKYSIGTMIGAAIVIACLRSITSRSK